MLEKYYLKEDQEIFTNRERELAKLESDYKNFSLGTKLRLALIGLRRVGKTSLIFESIRKSKEEISFIYLDFKRMSFVPENFSLQYVASCIYWVFKPKEDLTELYEIENLIRISAENKEIVKYLIDISEALNKKAINRNYLFEKAISFPEFLSKILKKKIIVILDEFQEILRLNKYEDIKEVIDKFRSCIQAQEVGYVLSGSVISLMEKITSKTKSALFLQFEKQYLGNFDLNSAIELVTKLSKRRNLAFSNETSRFLYKLTYGHPFYLTVLTPKIIENHQLYGYSLDTNLVKKVFLLELTNIKSSLYEYFSYIYNDSLERARGENLLKLAMEYLAREDGLKLSEISKLLNKGLNMTQTALNELIKVDLLIKTEDKRYYFKDQVFRQWLRYFYLGYQVDEELRSKFLEELLKDLEEKYLQASTDLGKAKEYEWKVKLEKDLKLRLEKYEKDNVEFDLVGKKQAVWHIFEVKHRNKPTSYKDIKEFLDKIEKSEFKNKKKKLFFVSKAGYTEEAKKLIEKNRIEIIR